MFFFLLFYIACYIFLFHNDIFVFHYFFSQFLIDKQHKYIMKIFLKYKALRFWGQGCIIFLRTSQIWTNRKFVFHILTNKQRAFFAKAQRDIHFWIYSFRLGTETIQALDRRWDCQVFASLWRLIFLLLPVSLCPYVSSLTLFISTSLFYHWNYISLIYHLHLIYFFFSILLLSEWVIKTAMIL